VTNDLERRIIQHRLSIVPGYTSKYRIHRLVYVEFFGDIREAIVREKQIKSWRREKKIALIEAKNATWEDLAAALCPAPAGEKQIPRPPSRARDDSKSIGARLKTFDHAQAR
jgi:putative endonuclease